MKEHTFTSYGLGEQCKQTPCLPFGVLSLRDKKPNSFPYRSFFLAIPSSRRMPAL
jgi:hypothetical protein